MTGLSSPTCAHYRVVVGDSFNYIWSTVISQTLVAVALVVVMSLSTILFACILVYTLLVYTLIYVFYFVHQYCSSNHTTRRTRPVATNTTCSTISASLSPSPNPPAEGPLTFELDPIGNGYDAYPSQSAATILTILHVDEGEEGHEHRERMGVNHNLYFHQSKL